MELTPPIHRATARLSVTEELITRLMLGAFVLVGLVLRVYNLSPVAWVPDHYERLIEVSAMLDGELPSSAIYAPGFSLVLLLPSAIFGVSIATMQAVTIGFGVMLIPLVYLLVLQVTGDRTGSLVAAGMCVVSPIFVFTDRFGFVDSPVTTLAVLAIYLVPQLKPGSIRDGTVFGLLLSLLFLLRQTNVILIPPLVVYWLLVSGIEVRLQSLLRAATSPLWVIAGGTFVVVSGLATLPSNWYAVDVGGFVSLSVLPANLAHYWFLLAGNITAPILFPFVALGWLAMLRTNRPFAILVLLVLVIWTVGHSPVSFTSARYMSVGYVLTYAVAAPFAVGLTRRAAKTQLGRVVKHGTWVAGCLLAALYLIGDGNILANWQLQTTRSDYGMSREVAAPLREIEAGSLVVTSVAKAFEGDALRIEFVDLLDVSLVHEDRLLGSQDVEAAISDALDQGRRAFYIYSHLEAEPDEIGGIFAGHDIYFEQLDGEYNVREVFRTRHERLGGGHAWVLFEVTRLE